MKGFEGKRVLITGGLGFIGSNLARRLLDVGAEVTLVDSMIPEYGGNERNIFDIREQLTVNYSDVRDEYSMAHLIKGKDYLFNLAGQTSHLDSMKEPFTDLEINCKAQLSILEVCRHHNPGIKVVFASTRQVYGRPEYLPVDEKHILRPVDVNGINKMAGERYHILYNDVYGIRTCVLRFTNTYGPGMRVVDARQTFVGIWVRCVLEGNSFEIWGGDQRRDFTYVDDCVDAMLLAALRSNADGKIYNLGADDVVTLQDLAKLLVKVAGQGEFVIIPFPEERKRIDIGDFCSDASLITKELGWRPQVSLVDGLSRTLDYYRSELSHYI